MSSELSTEISLRIRRNLKDSKQTTTKHVSDMALEMVKAITTLIFVRFFTDGAPNRWYQEKYSPIRRQLRKRCIQKRTKEILETLRERNGTVRSPVCVKAR